MAGKVYVRIYRGLIAAMLIILVSVILIVLSAYYIFTHKPLPQIQGQIQVSGVKEDITILRDKWGVPHVSAKTRQDLFFGVGYVQAQDRLFQMDLIRRVANGRTAEWLGPEALPSDKMARLIGFGRLARKNFEKIPLETKACLEAYSRGVNELAEYKGTNLPVEYKALEQGFEPWQPEDSLAIALYRAFCLSAGFRKELVRGMIACDSDSIKHYDRIFPASLHNSSPGLPRTQIPKKELDELTGEELLVPEKVRELLEADRQMRRYIGADLLVRAYDSWAVGAENMSSGSPLLSSSAYFGLQLPAVWYELHLHGPEINVIGATLPGLPVLLLGRNRNFAWSASPALSDCTDLYIETLHPEDPERYRAEDGYQRFKTRTETITVGSAGGIKRKEEFKIRISEHGPVLDMLSGPAASRVISLRWTGHGPLDPAGPYLRLMEARGRETFLAALQGHQAPVMNFLYADKKNNLVYKKAGKVPVRKGHSGIVPVTGHDSAHGWNGFTMTEGLPEIVNPHSGVLISGSLEPVLFQKADLKDGDCPLSRHHELFSGAGDLKLTAKDVQDLQLDTVSRRARLLLPFFLEVLEEKRRESDEMDRAFRQLDDWNYDMAADLAAPTIFAHVYREAFRLTYEDEMSGPAFDAFASHETSAIIFDLIMQNKSAPVFDDRRTPETENRSDIVERALESALSTLSETAGPRMSTWRWGKFHRISLEHPLGEWPVLLKLASYFGINPEPAGLSGGRDTVNMAYYRLTGEYEVRTGASLRFTAGLGDVNGAWLSYPGGQSGQPFSPHYLDVYKLWERGRGHPMLLDKDRIEENREASLKLVPGNREG
ncbi:MAG: penicillin acylase family protein [bacterium]